MDDISLTKRIGVLVRQLRREAGLSQEEFAERCNLHRTYVGAIERGEKTITIETANKIAEAFKISLSQLFLRLETMQNADNATKLPNDS